MYPSKKEITEAYESLDNLHEILVKKNWCQTPVILGNKPAVEFRFKFNYDGHERYYTNVSGSIDLLLCIDDKYHIIDWKSGSDESFHKLKLEDADQLIMYSAAIKKLNDINEETLHYVYFYCNKVFDYTVEDEHFIHLKNRINTIIDAYETNSFEKTHGTHCNICEYKKHCTTA